MTLHNSILFYNQWKEQSEQQELTQQQPSPGKLYISFMHNFHSKTSTVEHVTGVQNHHDHQ